MPEESYEYGMDRDLKAKQEAKYDPELEREVVEWLEVVSGEKKGDATPAEWLKNGQVLCAAVNAIRPGTIKKVNTSSMPFKQMENTTYFMNAAREIGVPESAMFGTPDLYEEKNMMSVINCIYTFGGAVQVSCPEYTGPKLGVPLNVEAKVKKRETVQATQTGGLKGTLEKERPTERADYCVRPIQGATSSRPSKTLDPATAAAAVHQVAAKSGVAAGTPNEECVYGMDKDIKDKQEAKYDADLERETLDWVEAVTGEKRGDATVAEWLKNGQVLCALANAIRPGIVKKVNTSALPFKQMENITFFMNAAREIGVPESAMFGTPDLFEEKNMNSVINCIFSFGGTIQVKCPEFEGPKLGVAMHVEAKTKKRESKVFVDQNAGFSTACEVQRPTERADYCVRGFDRSGGK